MAVLAMPLKASAFGVLSTFGKSGAGPGQTSFAAGMAIAPNGYLYVADLFAYRVEVFAPDGTFVRAFGKGVNPGGGDVCTTATGCVQGSYVASAGGLWFPIDIALDASGLVYVANLENNRIEVFTPEGSFVRAFGKGVNPGGGDICTAASGCQKGAGDGSAGSILYPSGIAISGNSIYVAAQNERIDVFALEGKFLHAFGKGVNPSGGDFCTPQAGCRKGVEVAAAGGISLPFDVAVSSSRIAVSDNGNNRIDIFDSAGNFLFATGMGVNPSTETSKAGNCTTATGCRRGVESAAAGGVAYPSGIAFDAAGSIVVADGSSYRVNEFAADGRFIRGFGDGVMNGEPTLQLCSMGSGCRTGNESSRPSSLINSFGLALDCQGAIYATTFMYFSAVPQIIRFGEPGTARPPCLPSASGGSADALLEASAPGKRRPTTAKPTIKIELNKGSGTATLEVIVSDPGTLTLTGKGIRKVKRQAKRAGLVEITVSTKGALREKLEATGKAAAKITLAFKADNGATNTQTKKFGLKMVTPP